MPRPRGRRHIQFSPEVTYFKPRGVPLSTLEQVSLTPEELEAMRLAHVENLEQKESAKQMQTSQSTFWRILESAEKKVADALVHGKAIKIDTSSGTEKITP